MIYSWETSDGRVLFSSSVEVKHPLEVIVEWAENVETSENYQLINFWEIPEKLHKRYRNVFL